MRMKKNLTDRSPSQVSKIQGAIQKAAQARLGNQKQITEGKAAVGDVKSKLGAKPQQSPLDPRQAMNQVQARTFVANRRAQDAANKGNLSAKMAELQAAKAKTGAATAPVKMDGPWKGGGFKRPMPVPPGYKANPTDPSGNNYGRKKDRLGRAINMYGKK